MTKPAPGLQPDVPQTATGYPAPPELEGLVANIRIPSPPQAPAPLEVTEDPEAVYQEVLATQLARAARPVAEARARVARNKAASGIPRGDRPTAGEAGAGRSDESPA